MSEDPRSRSVKELVLPEGEYAYTQDTTKGVTMVRVGPNLVNLQGQDRPVVYNDTTRRFDEVGLLEAAKVGVIVPKGHYAVLQNPAKNGQHPPASSVTPATELLVGQRVHISGPAAFALWPRQTAKVIEGHQLRLNQYLLIRVYDEDAARGNWAKAVVKSASPPNPPTPNPSPSTEPDGGTKAPETETVVAQVVPEDLSVGRLFIIRGTEVSFYIPPTGIEVVPDERNQFVRDALTLERLQYCILVDENGRSRYVQGPDVVFPRPTERFFADENKDRKFKPFELNGEIQGVHVKVVAAYTDTEGLHGEKGKAYKVGDELFITGKTTPIYFPCEQHTIVRYDGRDRHYATAIPAGDARYVLSRHTGQIKMVTGGEKGTVYLPNPLNEVFAKRVLTDAECELLYPGNAEVLAFNQALRQVQTGGRSVVEENVARHAVRRMAAPVAAALSADMSALEAFGTAGEPAFGANFDRPTTYSEPRSVTLGDNKFAGVPKIDIHTGYAILVKDTAGNRRVEVGPKRVLLGFNETLEAMTLSTGKPKNQDRLLRTAYLQINHNKVTDIVDVETADHVNVQIKVVLRVDFEGEDPVLWFSVANYVKLLCDHVRSVLKGSVRRASIEEFHARSEDFIRDAILGKKPEDGSQRPGMAFEENSMRVYDVEVLAVTIGDANIQQLLAQSQHTAVRTSIELATARRDLEASRQREEIARLKAAAKDETDKVNSDLEIARIKRGLAQAISRYKAAVEEAAEELAATKAKSAVQDAETEAENARRKAEADTTLAISKDQQALRLEGLKAETEATTDRLSAASEGFTEALLALGNQETLVKVAEAMSVQSFIGGKTLVEVVEKVFEGTPLANLAEVMAKRAVPGPNGAHHVPAAPAGR